jgi:hypothetical protein
VKEMEAEFKARIKNKREAIERMRLKAREHAIVEAVAICERCSCDIAPVKTLEFINNELHQAKCAFGTLSRVELVEAQTPKFASDRDYVELYIEEYDNLKSIIKP